MDTISEIIDRIDEIKPNAFSRKAKLKWIAELDGKMAVDVFLMNIEEVQQLHYSYPEDLKSKPLVKFPHDSIYDLWLAAKIDFENGEYGKYQNTMEQFNAHYGNFVRWFGSTYEPSQGKSCRDGAYTKALTYYITAYGLAVMRGFTGTLDEWMDSLKGCQGEKGEMGKSAYDYAVAGGYEGSEDDFASKMAFEFPTIEALNNMISHISRTDNPHNTSAENTGADEKGTAEKRIKAHNNDNTAHADIREAINGLTADDVMAAPVDHEHEQYLKKQESAAAAEKLATARTIQVDLASASASGFDGTENVKPGVYNALPMTNGGHGATDGSTGLKNLLAAGPMILSPNQYGTELPSNPVDGQFFVLIKE